MAAECMAMLNPDQQAAFEKITLAITNNTGQLFFLHGPGGTGKTFLYNTLCYHLHSQQKIVLCIASSGIAALLLKGGRTAHSAFKIPIPCHESSICGFSKNSQLGELICHTNLGPIWLPGFGFTYCLVLVLEFSRSHYCDRDVQCNIT